MPAWAPPRRVMGTDLPVGPGDEGDDDMQDPRDYTPPQDYWDPATGRLRVPPNLTPHPLRVRSWQGRQTFGMGQDTTDSLWDRYQAREVVGAMGAGAQGGMGAGGVYVKFPDNTMHWDETRPDPNPKGGSVIDSATNQPISGANRQSYPTGPGGIGPSGSQSRAAHRGLAASDPHLYPLGTVPMVDYDPTIGQHGPIGSTMSASTTSTLPSSATADVQPTSKSTRPHAVAGELDPTAFRTYGLDQNWPGFSGFGGGQERMGAGQPQNQQQQGVIDPFDLASLQNTAANIQVSNNQEQDSHQEALLKLAQDWAIHKDDLAYQQGVEAENERHNKATEDLTRQQQAIDVRMAQMQEGTQIYMQQGQQAFQDWQQRQSNYMSILGSALNNPWLQQLSGMAPPGQEAAVMGGGNIPALIQQILSPFDVSQFGVQNAPAATGLNAPPTASWNQLSQQIQAKAGSNYNDAAAKQLFQSMTGQAAGNVPVNLGQDQIDAIVSAGSNGQITSYGALTGQGPTTSQGVQPGQQQAGQGVAGAQGPVTQQVGLPDWSTWQSWSPWQKAAYRTNVEAEGPGAWNQQQAGMQSSFAAQGGSPDITQLAAVSANPAEQVGQQMTANVFGETTPQWQAQQSRQWSQAQAPQVRQSLGGAQSGASSSAATPEQQFGL